MWSNYSVPQRPHVIYHATSCGCMARERMIAIRVRPVSTVDELADPAVSLPYGTSDPGNSVQGQVCGPVPTSGVNPEVSIIVRTHNRSVRVVTPSARPTPGASAQRPGYTTAG